MRFQLTARLPIMIALAAALAAAPADAQGKGKKDKEKDKSRPELVRRDQARQKADKKRAEYLREERKRYEEIQRENRKRQEELLRDRSNGDWDDRDWDDDREWNDRRFEGQEKGPPFCRNGKGHPVHGRRWCEEKGFGSGGVFSSRNGDYERSRDYRDGSYERAHQDFHYQHDRQCRSRAAERPLDLQWQIQVRSECKRRHDDWHIRAGQRHQ